MAGHATDGERHGWLSGILRAVTGTAVRFPRLTLALCLVSATLAVVHTQQNLEFKTSRGDLIDPKTEYHQRWLNYIHEFGDVTEDMVVVVEGPDAPTIQAALDDLGPLLERDTRLFKNVLYKVDLRKLREKSLQYSSPEQLQFILGQLDEFSPLLKRFDLLTLRGFLRELRHALDRAQSQPEEVAAQMTEPLLQQASLLISSLEQYGRDERHYESPWQSLALGEMHQLDTVFRDRYLLNEKETMGFLKVQPTAASSDFNGTSPSISRLRELMDEAGRRHPRLKFGLTGIPVLESDEMRDSQTAMFYASVISFFGVGALMLLGFRGFRYPLVGSLVLLVGMAWSFAFTTIAVGHLNILSVSFAAMLIGIGIDYATVYLMRYLEVRHEGRDAAEAVVETATSSGAGIWTAAISSAVAFFCAMLTDFAGVAELGVIAGGGILLCTVAAFVVIPAVLVLIDRGAEAQELPRPLESRGLRLLAARYPAWVIVLGGSAIAWISTHGIHVKYDYNLLHLQAQGLESVEVQTRIFEQSDNSLLFAVSLADNPQQVLELKRKFEALPTVHHVEELAAMLPRTPIEDTQLLVQAVHAQLSQLPARPSPPRDVAPKPIGEELEALEMALESAASPTASAIREQINQFLDRFEQWDGPEQGQVLRDYQARLGADMLSRLKLLEATSTVDPVGPGDLSQTLVGRFISPQGKWLLQIYPNSQIWDIQPLEKFIADVRSVDPEATGTPLQTYEASKAIRRSYETIGIYALIAVCMLLALDFRNLVDCLMALLPPLAGAGLMFGLLALCQIDLNPANLIVLPLVIGLGVDGGVHIVHDYRMQRGAYVPTASVLNAIIVNSTTTMVGFGSMMIAAHRGLYSLGLVLTIGVGACMLVAIVIVPAILTLVSQGREAEAAPDAQSPAVTTAANAPAVAAAASDSEPPATIPMKPQPPAESNAGAFVPPPHLGLTEPRTLPLGLPSSTARSPDYRKRRDAA